MNRLASFVPIFVLFALLSGCVAEKRSPAGPPVAAVSDDRLIAITEAMRALGDREANVAEAKNKYAARLARLTGRLENEDGLALNFKAYIAGEVDAYALADGSIRVSSGLMDRMTDNELVFIIGHYIGHVKSGNCLEVIRAAYASSGAFASAADANGNAGGALSEAELASLLQSVRKALLSREQECGADAYGYNLLKKYKIDAKAALSALIKLCALGSGGEVLAGHPNSDERVQAVRAMLDADAKKK